MRRPLRPLSFEEMRSAAGEGSLAASPYRGTFIPEGLPNGDMYRDRDKVAIEQQRPTAA